MRDLAANPVLLRRSGTKASSTNLQDAHRLGTCIALCDRRLPTLLVPVSGGG